MSFVHGEPNHRLNTKKGVMWNKRPQVGKQCQVRMEPRLGNKVSKGIWEAQMHIMHGSRSWETSGLKFHCFQSPPDVANAGERRQKGNFSFWIGAEGTAILKFQVKLPNAPTIRTKAVAYSIQLDA